MPHRGDTSGAGAARDGSVVAAPVLPIAAYRDALVEAVEQSACVVIVGETGSGKTTQLPQYLVDAGVGGGKPIVVTQPRRVAAISVAQRVAAERGCAVGEEVGYEVRFERETTAATRLKYVTDGCLLRECTADPASAFGKYGVVILDEAHIRSMDTDVLFGLAKQLLDRRQPDTPKLVIMSATLNAERFVEFFGGQAFRIPGRLFPVEIVSTGAIGPSDLRTDRFITECVSVAMEIHCTQTEGDVLVFLTGQAEIESAAKRLFKLSEELDYREDVKCRAVDGLMIVPMYGAMSSEDQIRVFTPSPKGIRKLVLATDIASTSLTIDGVVYVVDGGFVKQKSFNPATGLDALQVVPPRAHTPPVPSPK